MPSSSSRIATSAKRPSPSLPILGEVLAGKFLVERILGEGGMCFVYAARHLQLDGEVAIKVLRPDVLGEAANPEEIVERFMREGRAASQIRSEHVVRTYDVGTLPDGGPFLVMEYLAGRDLDALLREHGPLPLAAAVDYVLQAGEAIAEAHARGIIHRDLKPANLFLTWRPDGTPFVKVLDFGISKIIRTKRRDDPALTGTANIVGTPHYMSPEQLRGSRDIDARADIWALGAILHELLSGQPPFTGTTMPEICANILKDEPSALAPLRPEVPPGLQAVVFRCLEKIADDRFPTVAALAQALAEFATPTGQACAQRIAGIARTVPIDQGGFRPAPRDNAAPWDSAPSLPLPAVRPPRRRKTTLFVFAAIMTVTGGILAFAFTGHRLAIEEALAPLYPAHTTAASTPTVLPQSTITQAQIAPGDAGAAPAAEVTAAPSSTTASPSTASPTASSTVPAPAEPTATATAAAPAIPAPGHAASSSSAPASARTGAAPTAKAPRASSVRVPARPSTPRETPRREPDDSLFEERK